MAALVQASIMNGTVNSHGMSPQIISIIQMQLAWVLVIMVPITPDTILMLRDIIKVIMDTEINTMSMVATATSLVAEVEAEVATAVEGSHTNFPSSLARARDSIVPVVRLEQSPQDLRQMPQRVLIVTSTSLAGRYDIFQRLRMELRQKQH
jgi:hypothetical protein